VAPLPPGPEAAEREWRAAVAALYDLTRFDRPRGPVDRCDHCVSEAEAIALRTVDREAAPAGLMDRYGFKAMTTWGDEREFRWFLPRLLELLGDDPGGNADASVLAGKLEYAGWSAWPAAERDAVRRVFVALWGLWLDGARPWREPWCAPDHRRPIDPTEILAALARLGVETAPLVDDLVARAAVDQDLAAEVVLLAEDFAATADATNPFPGERDVAQALIDDDAITRLDRLALHLADARADDDPAALADRLMYAAERLQRHLVHRASR
jgi:hypothetical protein